MKDESGNLAASRCKQIVRSGEIAMPADATPLIIDPALDRSSKRSCDS